MTIHKVLHDIQQKLKVPKNQKNTFGGYNYRSAEDILEAAKKILPEGYTLRLTDTIQAVGEYAYVIATATLADDSNEISVSGCARDAIERKGMDASQITGAASSYARKYAMNGLFCLDDTKDADATNDQGKAQPKAPAPKNDLQTTAASISKQLKESHTIDVCNYVWKGFAKELADIKKASPDKAYPALEKVYADKLTELSQAPLEG